MKANPKTIKLAIAAAKRQGDSRTLSKLIRLQKGCWNPKAHRCDCPACGGGNE
jgi:hypothetical protein